MPCNAYGHPPTCDCGWGGVFHAPAGHAEYGAGYWSRQGSHTVPNARCPVCRATVFFYRSPDDGRVFFDSLGPPWPKHPCTDGNRAPSRSKASQAKIRQKREGWWPFLCISVLPLHDSTGSVLTDADGRQLFTEQESKLLSAEAPIWIHPSARTKGAYEVSTLRTVKGKTQELCFTAFKDMKLLSEGAPVGVVAVPEGRLVADAGASSGGKSQSRFENATLQRSVLPERRGSTLPEAGKGKAKQAPGVIKVEVRRMRTFVRRDSEKKGKFVLEKSTTYLIGDEKSGQTGNVVPKSGATSTAIELAFSRLANTEDGQRALDELKRRGR